MGFSATRYAFVFVLSTLIYAPDAWAVDDPQSNFTNACLSVDPSEGRVVCADITAIDQTLVYNRFGSFNPFGMIFALNRDVVPIASAEPLNSKVDLRPTAVSPDNDCDDQLGTETREAGEKLTAGDVRLRDCKRPRPMVLRVNVGDQLMVHVSNLLTPEQSPDYSSGFCHSTNDDKMIRAVRAGVAQADPSLSSAEQKRLVEHGEADCGPRSDETTAQAQQAPDWPNTRHVNFVMQGMAPMPLPGHEKADPACFGTGAVNPDKDFYCLYKVQQEGTYFFASMAAPAGGEGNGGSLVHGLFGSVLAERPGSRWYRSQVTSTALDAAWPVKGDNPNRTRSGSPDYEAVDEHGMPILNLARPLHDPNVATAQTPAMAQANILKASRIELVHSDLNAIIYCDDKAEGAECAPELPQTANSEAVTPDKTIEPAYRSYREFSVFFHDELKTFYTRNFRELSQFGQLAGVKDGFAINYGASGMGSLLLANRKGIGPANDCIECLYEEFFLASWANGDPALLENYPDDPSNVHHSYLNDPVVFRNFHAGPKEAHVFHLHAHQWFAGNDPKRGSYLDSQTVAPQQGFTYNIYHGGLNGPDGDQTTGGWASQGSGNRNRTVGDSIFHCHLYPHFAQGMWALWRVHDMLEDGTRLLPDGQPEAGLSIDFIPEDDRGHARQGSIDRRTGLWLEKQEGTPIPALVPLPGEALPLAPSYATEAELDDNGELLASAETPMPGYPFYIAGQPGHRPPQAPLDIARNLGAPDDTQQKIDERSAITPSPDLAGADQWLDGGLNRHIVLGGSKREFGTWLPETVSDLTKFEALDETLKVNAMRQVVAKAFALGDLSAHMTTANIDLLDPFGERLERAAMGFHYNGKLFANDDAAPQPLKLRSAASSDPINFDSRGGYPTTEAVVPPTILAEGDAPPANAPARIFPVNAASPRPGAPFADPCGMRNGTEAATAVDPLTGSWLLQGFTGDPLLNGFRRYEASAVQLDMVVNRAGWHDPQARINVLTHNSDSYKYGSSRALNSFDSISPIVSDSEEPFFFRALSGECIEFRHTNELPKELELDDFQVKTPTDTIGQHIHLVKFDATASDGSGNGWNYEDGTFAPDEIAGRLCAWKESGSSEAQDIVQKLGQQAYEVASASTDSVIKDAFKTTDFCSSHAVKGHDIWRLPRSKFPFLFQTTTQRWFADPILSNNENGDPIDRTMRTVFTHDHFGPSSIQQHGFYAALLIEPPAGTGGNPAAPEICDFRGNCESPLAEGSNKVAWGNDLLTGARKLIITTAADPEHPDFREFALSIADFALLYDPRDKETPDGLLGGISGELFGMAKIYCEARHRRSPFNLDEICNTSFTREDNKGSFYYPEEFPPAWLAGGVHRDDAHKRMYLGDMMIQSSGTQPEIQELRDHLVEYRQKAAAPGQRVSNSAPMAKPVAPPERPESISVDHHDPYLVNYRGSPIPLRIADKAASTKQSNDCAPKGMARPAEHPAGHDDDSDVVEALINGSFGECSFSHQIRGPQGDLASALSSEVHGDPETPVLEAYANERIVLRMIQGAQEVQHSFNLVGQALKRNVDQAFGQGTRPLVLGRPKTIQEECHERAVFAASRPGKYREWFNTAPSHREEMLWSDGDVEYWKNYEAALADCDNAEGFIYAQEIGISEHFEMQGSLRADVSSPVEFGVAPDAGEEDDADDLSVPTTSSDYLWHFGSVDAIWNGAWGLVRIFKDADAPDPTTVSRFNENRPMDEVKISERLGTPIGGAESIGGEEPIPGGTGLSCPIPTPGQDPAQRVVDAVIVAFETRQVFSKDGKEGTDYGNNVYDPDGMMLALMSPAQMELPDISDDDSWDELTKDDAIKRLKDVYSSQPEPFLLRVRAGDCLRLRVVNLLGEADGSMRDLPGDAMLPKIVPLNADPIPQAVEVNANGDKVLSLDRLPDQDRPYGVVPSSKLALNLGLPGLDLIRDLPSGFGYNQQALGGGQGNPISSPMIAAFAGRYRIDLPENYNDEIIDSATEYANEAIAVDPESYFGQFTPPDGAAPEVNLAIERLSSEQEEADIKGLASILGDAYVLYVDLQYADSPIISIPVSDSSDSLAPLLENLCGANCPEDDNLHEALQALTQKSLGQALDKHIHWIPYAFGAVPVRPTGDVISQTPHGLFGAIDVVPQSWDPIGASGLACKKDTNSAGEETGYEFCQASYISDSGSGQPARYETTNDSGSPVTIREFVLFYQDGLNHWDDASQMKVVMSDTGRPLPETEIGPAKIVPDCEVCDDSYDRGEVAVSQKSPAFSRMLRDLLDESQIEEGDNLDKPQIEESHNLDKPRIEESDNLNSYVFPEGYALSAAGQPRLSACEGEQVVIRVVHPGGRARQRTFSMNGYSYDDLFPGFGFPRSALLAPGKSISAWLQPYAYPGKVVWHDGPTHLRAGGAWGLIETVDKGDPQCTGFQAQ